MTPETRAQAQADNSRAPERLARNLPPPPLRTCTIFEHRDYGGAQWTLGNGDDLKMVEAPDYGISDGIHRFLYEPFWNDAVSSFRVGATCTLTLWEHVDHGGTRFRTTRNYSYVGDDWNDVASEAVCECEGLPNW